MDAHHRLHTRLDRLAFPVAGRVEVDRPATAATAHQVTDGFEVELVATSG